MIDAVVDLSHYQPSVDFIALQKAGIAGVILKATQGTQGVDSAYARRRDLLTPAVGLLRGAYHFGIGGNGGGQAHHFLDTACHGPGDLLALDVERNPSGASMSLADAEAFVAAVFVATGRYPVLYGGADYLGQLGVTAASLLARCPIWWAAYHDPDKGSPKIPQPWGKWALWQYTDRGAVAGLTVDRSLFAGDLAGLSAWWGR